MLLDSLVGMKDDILLGGMERLVEAVDKEAPPLQSSNGKKKKKNQQPYHARQIEESELRYLNDISLHLLLYCNEKEVSKSNCINSVG